MRRLRVTESWFEVLPLDRGNSDMSVPGAARREVVLVVLTQIKFSIIAITSAVKLVFSAWV